MAAPKKVLRLDQLRHRVAGQMEIGGKMHDVLQPTLAQQQTIIALEVDPSANTLDGTIAVVRQLVPSLSDEEFAFINTDMAVAIITLAGGNIDAVEKAFPNAVSPETDPPTSPG